MLMRNPRITWDTEGFRFPDLMCVSVGILKYGRTGIMLISTKNKIGQ